MSAEIDNACPTLPSSESAYRAIQGEPKAFLLLARDLVFRASLIGAGMLVAGERKHVVRNALAGSLMIETFVLGWIWLTQTRPLPPSGRVLPLYKYPWQTQPFYVRLGP